MINLVLSKLGLGPKTEFAALMKQGAQIIDVRTKEEYKSGHISGSINIPLQSLSDRLSQIKKDKPIITCCASGMRSLSAKGILISKGFEKVHNGGGWRELENKIRT